jgi:oxygen-independent coproporphyrinogen-3 oxidase
MAQPQRHRLLHGYPMVLPAGPRPWVEAPPSDRPLLVGVLPHPYCNPTVRGCGFCTFPHERLMRSRTLPLALSIAREIGRRAASLRGRQVPAVYLGGGTANLTPPDAFAVIVGALASAFDLSQAEVTLEGAPAYFDLHEGALLRLTRSLGARRVRISMGVQTFDEAWLRRMGRLGLGSPTHVEEAVALAQRTGVGTSADLLVNLPGQPVAAMLDDVGRAAALGLDQICIYPLVLRSDLDAAWASDAQLLAALPSPAAGFETWRAVRERLGELGYVQRTLTNFERADLPAPHRFAYEPWSFRPTTCDGVGFGPGALSTFGLGTGRAVKWQNVGGAQAYLDATAADGPVEGVVRYTPVEEALTVLTRRLVLLRAPLPEAVGDWPLPELDVLQEAGLLTCADGEVVLTEAGIFYADTVAGLLAETQVRRRRVQGDAVPLHMG